MKDSHPTPLRFKLILAGFGLVIGLVTLEIGLRIVPLPPVFTEYQTCVFVPDEELGYRFQANSEGLMYRNAEISNSFRISSEGFHDSEPWSELNRISIFALGDSFTAALYVPLAEGWTQILEAHLHNAGFDSVDVLNRGVDGYGTANELDLLKEMLPTAPSPLVMLAFFENDIGDVELGKIYRECYRGYLLLYQDDEQRTSMIEHVDKYYPTSLQSWLYNHLYTFRVVPVGSPQTRVLLKTNFVRPGDAGLELKMTNGERTLDVIFEELISLSQAENFHLLVIPFPGRANGSTPSLDALKNNLSPEIYAALDVVDLSPQVESILTEANKQNGDLFWKFDGHFNAYGNQVYAEAVAEILMNGYANLLSP